MDWPGTSVPPTSIANDPRSLMGALWTWMSYVPEAPVTPPKVSEYSTSHNTPVPAGITIVPSTVSTSGVSDSLEGANVTSSTVAAASVVGAHVRSNSNL